MIYLYEGSDIIMRVCKLSVASERHFKLFWITFPTTLSTVPKSTTASSQPFLSQYLVSQILIPFTYMSVA